VAELPQSIDGTQKLLADTDYVADRSLATVLFLALKMGRPLFLEGEAGVGKTEISKVLAKGLGRSLIRLQCYEGLDVAAAVSARRPADSSRPRVSTSNGRAPALAGRSAGRVA